MADFWDIFLLFLIIWKNIKIIFEKALDFFEV